MKDCNSIEIARGTTLRRRSWMCLVWVQHDVNITVGV